MPGTADALRETLDNVAPRLRQIGEDAAATPRGAGKWSRKEILGHLIDSAVNNLHRFVRAQQVDRLLFPGYDQRAWVEVQAHARRPWGELVTLWEALNRHLAHLIATVPAGHLETPCVIGDGEAVTLGWLMDDYVGHLRHHLEQILG
jgi:hypothetical protein